MQLGCEAGGPRGGRPATCRLSTARAPARHSFTMVRLVLATLTRTPCTGCAGASSQVGQVSFLGRAAGRALPAPSAPRRSAKHWVSRGDPLQARRAGRRRPSGGARRPECRASGSISVGDHRPALRGSSCDGRPGVTVEKRLSPCTHLLRRAKTGCLCAMALISSSEEFGPTPSKKTPTSDFHRLRYARRIGTLCSSDISTAE